MPHHAALDVSNEETAIHVVDETGRAIWRGKRSSEPDALATALRRHALDHVRVGLETGFLTPWLYHGLKSLDVPVVCLEARHARAATALQRDKTDANDAETSTQLVRTGWYREARVRSSASHSVRHLVGARDRARAQLVGVATDLSDQVRSTLKTFGLMAGKGADRAFALRVGEFLEGRPTLAAIVEPLLAAWRAVREQIATLDRRLIGLAKGDPTCRPLMTCLGVIVATSFAAAVEAPSHFRRSRAVGAYLGLIPTCHQSGEIDRTGGISRRGDRLMRTYLFEAAASLLTRVRQDSVIRTWGRALAKRMGLKHAAVAIARELAVVLHAMWRGNAPLQPWPAKVG